MLRFTEGQGARLQNLFNVKITAEIKAFTSLLPGERVMQQRSWKSTQKFSLPTWALGGMCPPWAGGSALARGALPVPAALLGVRAAFAALQGLE